MAWYVEANSLPEWEKENERREQRRAVEDLLDAISKKNPGAYQRLVGVCRGYLYGQVSEKEMFAAARKLRTAAINVAIHIAE